MQKEETASFSRISRRAFLSHLVRLGIAIPVACGVLPVSAAPQTACPAPAPVPGRLAADDAQLLDEIEHANFLFFWEQANPQSGLVRDRFNVRTMADGVVGSIAATGFGLTALCIGQQRGYVSMAEASGRVLHDVALHLEEAAHSSRLFLPLGQREDGRKNLGLGSIVGGHGDSALRSAHLPASTFAIRRFAAWPARFFDRVDWTWLSEDTSLLPHGWTPEVGFLPYRWDYYSELMMMYLLGLGSAIASAARGNLERLEANHLRI